METERTSRTFQGRLRHAIIKFVEEEESLLTDEVDKLQPKEKKKR